jgi:hypothetical protein
MNVKRKMLSCSGKHWKRKVYILLEQITLFFYLSHKQHYVGSAENFDSD